jgi:ATPase subunit of ABC transporter with duplicated ATPase domains
VVVVSHDFRLIDQVAKLIWECTGPQDGATIRVWPGTIHEYKAKLAKKMAASGVL